jgi:hypothetical protein
MPSFDESIRPMILGEMRADGVRSLVARWFVSNIRHFRREPVSRNQFFDAAAKRH